MSKPNPKPMIKLSIAKSVVLLIGKKAGNAKADTMKTIPIARKYIQFFLYKRLFGLKGFNESRFISVTYSKPCSISLQASSTVLTAEI